MPRLLSGSSQFAIASQFVSIRIDASGAGAVKADTTEPHQNVFNLWSEQNLSAK